jgi:aminoglycoside phosphotransferase (APT) family kinase protein
MTTAAGWAFILDTRASNHLLIIGAPDVRFVSALSHYCKSISVVHFDSKIPSSIEAKEQEQGAGNATYLQARWDHQRLSLPSEHYDGVIIWNIDCLYPKNQQDSSEESTNHLNTFHSEIYRILKRNGYLFVGHRNRFGYNRLVSYMRHPMSCTRGRARNQYVSKRLVLGGIRNAGFHEEKRYHLITDGEVISEVLMENKYRSAKNSFTLKEIIRSRLLSGVLSRVFAPSVGIIYAKNEYQASYLECLLNELANKLVPYEHREDLYAKKYLVLPGKVIISIGPKHTKYGNWIVILPLNHEIHERLRHEADTLVKLHEMSYTIKHLVPKYLLQNEYQGQKYFVQQEIPGTTIDAPIRDLDRITRNALKVILKLHNESKRDVIVDEKLYTELYHEPLLRVAEKLGPTATALTVRLDSTLRRNLLGKQARLVWAHGDYKIENLMIDPVRHTVSGIIDWDLSKQNGLPYLDLMYLIAYNRVIREAEGIDEIFINIFINNGFTEVERSLCDEYCQAISLRNSEIAILIAMFWIYHVAYRIEVDATNKHELDQHLNTLQVIEDRTSVFFKHNQEVAAK